MLSLTLSQTFHLFHSLLTLSVPPSNMQTFHISLQHMFSVLQFKTTLSIKSLQCSRPIPTFILSLPQSESQHCSILFSSFFFRNVTLFHFFSILYHLLYLKLYSFFSFFPFPSNLFIDHLLTSLRFLAFAFCLHNPFYSVTGSCLARHGILFS